MNRWLLPRSPAARAVLGIAAFCLAFLGWRASLFFLHRDVARWVDGYGGWVDWAPPSGGSGAADAFGQPNGRGSSGFLERWGRHPAAGDIEGVYLQSSPGIAVAEMQRLARLPRLRHLGLDVSTLSDDHLKPLAGLRRLEGLSLRSSATTDAGLALLSGLDRLRHLDLSQTRVTDRGMRHLSGLVSLRHLNLFDTAVGDAGLRELRPLGDLVFLAVDERVTDAGVAEIARHRKLQSLFLHESPVTDRSMDLLLRELPDLAFVELYYTRVSPSKIAELKARGLRVQAAF